MNRIKSLRLVMVVYLLSTVVGCWPASAGPHWEIGYSVIPDRKEVSRYIHIHSFTRSEPVLLLPFEVTDWRFGVVAASSEPPRWWVAVSIQSIRSRQHLLVFVDRRTGACHRAILRSTDRITAVTWVVHNGMYQFKVRQGAAVTFVPPDGPRCTLPRQLRDLERIGPAIQAMNVRLNQLVGSSDSVRRELIRTQYIGRQFLGYNTAEEALMEYDDNPICTSIRYFVHREQHGSSTGLVISIWLERIGRTRQFYHFQYNIDGVNKGKFTTPECNC